MKLLVKYRLSGHAWLAYLIILGSLALVSGCISKGPGGDAAIRGSYLILAGSYSGKEGNDIHILKLDGESGEMVIEGGTRVGDNPSFIALSRDFSRVYAVNETDDYLGLGTGGITTLAFNAGMSEFEKLGGFSISGKGPCHISVDKEGDYLFLSNYGDGSFSVVANNSRGIPEMEAAYLKYASSDSVPSHTHMSYLQPGSNHLYVSDLGLDRLMVYNTFYFGDNIVVEEDQSINLPPGNGPRHFVVDTTGTVFYILNELSSEIFVIKRYLTGDYREIQRIKTLPEDFVGENYAADIHWSPDNRFLYTTNRGHNSIAVFEIVNDEMLELKGNVSCEGDWPRNFAISPDGWFMLIANQRSGTIDLFKIDQDTYMPEYTGNSVEINSPSCIIFVPLL